MPADFMEQGIQAARAGNVQRAVGLLSQAVRQAPDSALAWYWLSKVLDDPEKKSFCLERAARLDPSMGIRPAVESERQPLAAVQNQPVVESLPPAGGPPPAVKANQPAKAKGIRWPIWAAVGGLGVLVCGAGFYLLMMLITSGVLGTGNRAAAPAGLPAPSATQMVWPSATLTLSPSETPTRTLSPLPSETPELDTTQMYQKLAPQVTAARADLDEDRNDECVVAYNALLRDLPNWPSGYYNRGVCERNQAEVSTDANEYVNLLHAAIADVNKAISIGPAKGNYYFELGIQYNYLSDINEYWVDQQPYLNVAIADMQAGVDMGTTIPGAENTLSGALLNANRCTEALAEARRADDALPPATVSSGVYMMEANAYLCQENYSDALNAVDQSLKIQGTCEGYTTKTTILLGLGDVDKALSVISNCIKESPDFGGYRYYLRALIEYDEKKLDLAHADLTTGAGFTFFHGGLYAYLMGKFAGDDGQSAQAANWLQYADATVRPFEGGWLRDRIRKDLVKLNIPRIIPTASAQLDVTPLPGSLFTPQPKAGTVTPTPPTDWSVDPGAPESMRPPGAVDAIEVDFNDGTGKLTLAPNAYPLFHVHPTFEIAVRRVVSINLSMTPLQAGKPPIQISLWVKDGGWRMLVPVWGENTIEYPSYYILPAGDMYIAIRNYSPDQTLKIDNVNLLVTVELMDGSLKTYGKKN